MTKVPPGLLINTPFVSTSRSPHSCWLAGDNVRGSVTTISQFPDQSVDIDNYVVKEILDS
ncbi:MAG: hypothetical protein CME33_12585 [Gimesia sp.]|nr:hypothetical protein [Gimesia sp.]